MFLQITSLPKICLIYLTSFKKLKNCKKHFNHIFNFIILSLNFNNIHTNILKFHPLISLIISRFLLFIS